MLGMLSTSLSKQRAEPRSLSQDCLHLVVGTPLGLFSHLENEEVNDIDDLQGPF